MYSNAKYTAGGREGIPALQAVGQPVTYDTSRASPMARGYPSMYSLRVLMGMSQPQGHTSMQYPMAMLCPDGGANGDLPDDTRPSGRVAPIARPFWDRADAHWPETYRQILAAQGLTPEQVLPPGCEPDEDFSAEEWLVRLDLSSPVPKAAWTGHFARDWWSMVRNYVPLIQLCFVHELHPYSRTERIIVFIGQLFWYVLLASWLGLCETCSACGVTCDSGFAVNPNNTTCRLEEDVTAKDLDECCSRGIQFASHMVAHFSIGGYEMGGVFFTSLFGFLYIVISLEVMRCACVQHMSRKVRRCAQYLGYVVFGLVILTLIPSIMGLVLLEKFDKLTFFFINVIFGQLLSCLWLLALFTLLFSIIRAVQLPSDEGGIMECFDYPEDSQDTRNFLAKWLNPRYRVCLGDYKAWLEDQPPPPRYIFSSDDVLNHADHDDDDDDDDT